MALSTDLIVRPYNEIVDDVLVAMLGGVVNEPLIFDVREDTYPLSSPARDVRGITGTVDGQHYAFQPNIDWRFEAPQNTILFLERGKRPDNRSTFFVDYFQRDLSTSPLTDINIGSVTRTVAEAMSRELSVLYRQVNLAYQSGFIDLAAGAALDFVVAILGVQRKRGDFAQTLVTFFRTATARGNITIPQGTRLITEKGVLFETISERTLQRGQVRIDVPVRAGEAFRGPAGRVEATTITSMVIPIEGIDRITNFDPTVLGQADETDEDLRVRAKAALRGLGQCTVDALQLAAREAGATSVEITDPWFPPEPEGQPYDPSKHTPPGKVQMIVEVEPVRFPNVAGLVNIRRAAGINVQIIARYIFIKPRIGIKLRRNLTAAGKDQVKLDMINALAAFVAGLGSGTNVPGKGETDPETGKPKSKGLIDVLNEQPDVQEARIADLLVWRTVMDAGAQLGQRQAARELILNADGSGPADDTAIEQGNFQIKVEARFWPVLELEPADIQLTEP
jgi:hypothetical protein